MTLSVQNPGELIVAIPHLLGSQPQESIVFVPLRSDLPWPAPGSVEPEFSRQRLLLGGVATVVRGLVFEGRGVADRGVQPVVVEPCTHDKVVSSRSSTVRNGPSGRTHSAL